MIILNLHAVSVKDIADISTARCCFMRGFLYERMEIFREVTMKPKNASLTCETDYFSTRCTDDILVFRYKGNSLLASTIIKAKEMALEVFKRAEAHPRIRIVVLMHAPRKPRREEYLSFFDMVTSARLPETSVMRLYSAVDQLILYFLSSDLFFVAANCGKVLPMMIAISLACDYRILGDNTAIQNPALELGLIAKGGAPFFLRHHLPKGKIYELLLSRQDITAREAVAMGLGDRCLSTDNFEQNVMTVAAEFAALPPRSLCLAKRLINFSVADAADYLAYENKHLLSAMHQAKMGVKCD